MNSQNGVASNPGDHRLGNFADPFGLVCRMMGQGGTIGWSLLAMEVASHAVKPFDLAMQSLERRRCRVASSKKQPAILITGPPRSGTTLAHQLLHQYLDVSYFSNLNSLFPRSPVTSAKWFGTARNPPKSSYRSLYGNTSGLRGPNDAFHIWDRYLGHDRYRVDEQMLTQQGAELKRFVAAWTHATGKPLISKNNRNTVAMERLARHLPDAKFVVVTRDPFFIAQSLLRARTWVQGDARRPWGLQATGVACDRAESGELDPVVDAVCKQVSEILACIEAQLKEIDSDRWAVYDYQSLCEDPAGFVRQVASRWQVGLRPDRDLSELQPLNASNKVAVEKKVADRIRDCLASQNAMSAAEAASDCRSSVSAIAGD